MKIYLSPSDQRHNLYVYGNTNEATQCRRIATACKAALERCGFETKINTEDGDNAMYNRVAESNAWGADVHLCIHTNAGGGRGCVVFVDQLSERHKKYAQPVYDEIAAITVANESYGVRTANFYEIRKTTGLCLYVECEFHDNATDAKWIVDNATLIGESLCKGLCKAVGKKYVPVVTEKPKSEADLAKEYMISEGLIKGYADGQYHWNEPLTREQYAIIKYREHLKNAK